MTDLAVGGFSNLLDSGDSITMCIGLVIRLSVIYSILVIIKHSNSDEYGTDLYNLSISQLVFLFIAGVNVVRIHPRKFNFSRLVLISFFIILPFTQIILTIKNGSKHMVDDVDFGIAIATMCLSVLYIIF